MMRKRNWMIAAILGGTLLIGVGIGSVATLTMLKPAVQDRPPAPPEMGTVEMRKPPVADLMLRRMDRLLVLSESQRAALAAELEATSRAFESLHATTREQMEQIMDRTDAALKSHLTPEQIVRFDESFGKRRFGRKTHRGEGADWGDRERPGMRMRQGDDSRWERPDRPDRDQDGIGSAPAEQLPSDPEA